MSNLSIKLMKSNSDAVVSQTLPTISVGIVMHKISLHVTIINDDVEVFHATIPGKWLALHRLLERHRKGCCQVQVVYEAGYFGFWLHDQLVAYGAECLVTPPSLIPQ